MWGNNKAGSLGVNEYKAAYMPMRVSVPVAVSKFSLGIDHTIALGKAFA